MAKPLNTWSMLSVIFSISSNDAIEFGPAVKTLAAKLERPCAAIEDDGAALGDQKNRDAEEHEIHQREIPQGTRRSDEAAQLQALVRSAH